MIYLIYIILHIFAPIYYLILGTFRLKSALYGTLLHKYTYFYKDDQIEYLIPLGPWCENGQINQQNFRHFCCNYIPFGYKIERLIHITFQWYCGRLYRYRIVNGKVIWDSDV